MADRILSVSAAPYDGHALETVLESLARCGASHVEPAFIAGYTEPFDDSAFSGAEARRHVAAMQAAGLRCHAVSAHMDLGLPDAAETFSRRMEFAAAIGAGVINSTAAVVAHRDTFLRNIAILDRVAERLAIRIGLENAGDGRASLTDTAADGIALIDRIGSPRVRLNWDPGNTASHRPGADAAADAIRALPSACHLHIKDVARRADGWHFVPIGDGMVECGRVLRALVGYPDRPVSIELPLRMHRGSDALPVRRAEKLPLVEIEAAVRRSLHFARAHLAAAG